MLRLYLTDIRDLPDDYADLLQRVSLMRRQKVMQYRQNDDRRRSLAAGLFLNHVFGTAAMRIKEDSFGRPVLDGAESFNLSHSGNYVLLAIGGEAIGCDIQTWDIREAAGAGRDLIARRILHPMEFRFYEQAVDRSRIFYRFWTLKESYMKMTGQGFALAPDSFGFDLADPGRIRIYFAGNRTNPNLYFRLYEELPSCTAAVCTVGQAPPPTWKSVRFI